MLFLNLLEVIVLITYAARCIFVLVGLGGAERLCLKGSLGSYRRELSVRARDDLRLEMLAAVDKGLPVGG